MTGNDNFSLSGQPKDASARQRAATEAEVRQALELAERMRLTGIGGWLAAFYILYGVGWFFGIGMVMGAYYGHSESGMLDGVIAADWIGRVAVGLAMFAAHRSGPVPMRVGQAVQIACGIVQLVLVMSLLSHEEASAFAPVFIMLLSVIAYQVAWLIYFSKSLRVRYTYGGKAAGNAPAGAGELEHRHE